MQKQKSLINTIVNLINIAERDVELKEGIDKKNFVKEQLKEIITDEMSDLIDPILDSLIDDLVNIANNKIKLFKKCKFKTCISL